MINIENSIDDLQGKSFSFVQGATSFEVNEPYQFVSCCCCCCCCCFVVILRNIADFGIGKLQCFHAEPFLRIIRASIVLSVDLADEFPWVHISRGRREGVEQRSTITFRLTNSWFNARRSSLANFWRIGLAEFSKMFRMGEVVFRKRRSLART